MPCALFSLFLLIAAALAPAALPTKALPKTYATSPTTAAGSAADTAETQALAEWRAGSKVSLAAVRQYGESRCFTAAKIDKATFARMRGRSYKQGCAVPLSSLRYLRVLHYDSEGGVRLGEMVCASAISDDLLFIFRQLYDARYPIERMVLVDDYNADDERSMAANNTSCFNFRSVAGSRRLSKHSLGLAVDINPLYNPHVRRRQGKTVSVSPKSGLRYADRSLNLPMMIGRDGLCRCLFAGRGFRWGGDWRSSKDYQHFEK